MAEFRRHQRFWFSDGSLHLMVEDTLYRVHRYLFEIHAKKFLSDLGETDNATPNQRPYLLDGVKQVDFDRLLSFLYPCDLVVQGSRTPEEWVSVLKLASKWGFESLRTKAIGKAAKLVSPIEKILLGREYDIPDFLLPGYVALCQSSAPLSQDEGRRLGLEVVVNICNMRQELWNKEAKTIPAEEVLAKVKTYLGLPAVTTPSPQSEVSVTSTLDSLGHSPQESNSSVNNTLTQPDLNTTDLSKTTVIDQLTVSRPKEAQKSVASDMPSGLPVGSGSRTSWPPTTPLFAFRDAKRDEVGSVVTGSKATNEKQIGHASMPKEPTAGGDNKATSGTQVSSFGVNVGTTPKRKGGWLNSVPQR